MTNEIIESGAEAIENTTVCDRHLRDPADPTDHKAWANLTTQILICPECNTAKALAAYKAMVGELSDDYSFTVTEATRGAALRKAMESRGERIKARGAAFRAALIAAVEDTP